MDRDYLRSPALSPGPKRAARLAGDKRLEVKPYQIRRVSEVRGRDRTSTNLILLSASLLPQKKVKRIGKKRTLVVKIPLRRAQRT